MRDSNSNRRQVLHVTERPAQAICTAAQPALRGTRAKKSRHFSPSKGYGRLLRIGNLALGYLAPCCLGRRPPYLRASCFKRLFSSAYQEKRANLKMQNARIGKLSSSFACFMIQFGNVFGWFSAGFGLISGCWCNPESTFHNENAANFELQLHNHLWKKMMRTKKIITLWQITFLKAFEAINVPFDLRRSKEGVGREASWQLCRARIRLPEVRSPEPRSISTALGRCRARILGRNRIRAVPTDSLCTAAADWALCNWQKIFFL